LPFDIVGQPVDATRLDTPLDLTPLKNDTVENEVVSKILDAVYSTKNPMILADVFTSRFHSIPQIRELVEITQFPVFLHLIKLI
jgi:pyruvate decarboxylase